VDRTRSVRASNLSQLLPVLRLPAELSSPLLAAPPMADFRKEAWNQNMREFRFAVGLAKGRRSTVWRMWTHKAELYLHSRMMGGSTKVSIHSGGQAQWSMQSDWYGKNRPNQPNQARHIDKWRWAQPGLLAATHAFRLFIPSSELREIQVDEDLSNVEWLADPGTGGQVVVDCYVSPASANLAPTSDPAFLCALERDATSSIVAFARQLEVTRDDLDQVERLHDDVRAVVSRESITIQPGYRLVALATDGNGLRGMIEFVPPGA
jgi:hypothetical protein